MKEDIEQWIDKTTREICNSSMITGMDVRTALREGLEKGRETCLAELLEFNPSAFINRDSWQNALREFQWTRENQP